MLEALTERSTGQEDERSFILDAAVRVVARSGFHACRMAEIAEEAEHTVAEIACGRLVLEPETARV